MTLEQANIELEQLRGIAKEGGVLAPYKAKIAELYWLICRKKLRQCKCKNVLQDALLEIYAAMNRNKKNNKNSNIMAQARLVNGVVLQVGGNHYTNANLTDEVARAFLSAFPMRKDWFAELPADEPKEDTESVAELPADEPKVEKQPTAPKAKKSARKRK